MKRQALKEMEQRFRAKTQLIATLTSGRVSRESSKERDQRIARFLEPRQYGRFFDYYFGSQVHYPLSEASTAGFHRAAYRKLYQDRIITQFRLWFRGAAKSTQTNVGNAFALKCSKKLRFMLLVASSAWRAKLLLADLQAQLEVNERIIHDFGRQIQYGHWKDGMFETSDGCYFMALGINQSFRGLRRYASRIDFAVVDDVEDRKCIANRELIESRVDKILGDLSASFYKGRQRLVISNNYITNHGIVAGLLKRLCNKPHVHVSKVNLTNEKGKSTWSSYYSPQDVARIHEKHDTYTLQREYYNTPVEQSKVFRREWLRFEQAPEAFELLVGFWDFSYAQSGDYKAFVLLGLSNNCWYVLDIFCRKCDFTWAMDWYCGLLERRAFKEHGAYMYYDAMVAQEYVFGALLAEDWKRRGLSSGMPMPYKNFRISKHLRIETTLCPAFFQGHLRFCEHLRNQPDLQVGLDQLFAFGGSTGIHDDFPDALASAFQIGEEIRKRNKDLQNEGYMVKKRTPAAGF